MLSHKNRHKAYIRAILVNWIDAFTMMKTFFERREIPTVKLDTVRSFLCNTYIKMRFMIEFRKLFKSFLHKINMEKLFLLT